MPRPIASRPQELVLPAGSLSALRCAIEAEAGPDAAAAALRRAGFAAGQALAPLLDEPAGDAPSERAFWRRLEDLLAGRGWGRFGHELVHSGVGALEAGDTAEAEPDDGEARPSCFFTTGLLAALLSHAAGQDVGVLEAECRSRGDLRCRFLFGGPAALQAVFDAVAAGESADAAVARLD